MTEQLPDPLPRNVRARVSLLVLYTEQLDACRSYYARLGLPFAEEQHGAGPVHYAAELGDGLIIEIYPGKPDRTTGRLRLGLRIPATDDLPTGEHRLTDPDGRGGRRRRTAAVADARHGVRVLCLDLPFGSQAGASGAVAWRCGLRPVPGRRVCRSR